LPMEVSMKKLSSALTILFLGTGLLYAHHGWTGYDWSGSTRFGRWWFMPVSSLSVPFFVAKTTSVAPFMVCFVTDTSDVVTEQLHFAARRVCFTSKTLYWARDVVSWIPKTVCLVTQQVCFGANRVCFVPNQVCFSWQANPFKSKY